MQEKESKIDFDQVPKVGIGVMIFKDGKVLVGKRKNLHGSGMWAYPGGTLEYRESLKDCAKREVLEECGVVIKNLQFNCVIDAPPHAPKHFVTIIFVADWESGEAMVLEPKKCDSWEWHDINALPEPFFPYSKWASEGYIKGVRYFDNV